MPFALLIIGIFLLVAGVRNTAGPASQPGTLFALIHGDFTGSNNFIYWFLAIVLIGALGYIPKLKPISTAFLVLIIVVMFLRKGGFFTQFTSAIGAESQPSLPTNNLATIQSNISTLQQQINDNLQQQQANLPNLGTLGAN